MLEDLTPCGFNKHTFTTHRPVGGGGGYLFNSSLSLLPASQTLDFIRAITAENSPLHIVISRAQTRNPWTLSASC